MRLIENAERMRKQDRPSTLDGCASPDAPGRAGEIAEPVDRDDHGLVERRDMEGGGQMREVMLDVVEFWQPGRAGKALP